MFLDQLFFELSCKKPQTHGWTDRPYAPFSLPNLKPKLLITTAGGLSIGLFITVEIDKTHLLTQTINTFRRVFIL